MSSPEMRILLTGVSGQVGGEFLPLLQPFGAVIAPTRSDLDLSDAAAIRRFVKDVEPHWIINPAAYTAVDKSESEPELAYAINAAAPRALGVAAADLGIPVIHFSTDPPRKVPSAAHPPVWGMRPGTLLQNRPCSSWCGWLRPISTSPLPKDSPLNRR